MIVRGVKTTREKIELDIDRDEYRRVAHQYIRQKANLPDLYHWFTVEGHNLIGHIDHGGHGSGYVEEVDLGPVSSLQMAAIVLMGRD